MSRVRAAAIATPWARPSLSILWTFFPKKGVVRVEFIDEALHPLEDALEAEVMVLVLAEADDPESQETCLLPTDLDEAVAHDDGPGVDAHDDAL